MPHPSPPQLHLHLRTTTQILEKTTTIIFFSGTNHLISFLILSFFLFFLRYTTHVITHDITSYIDNTPSIHTILTSTKTPPKPTSPFHQTFAGTLLKTQVNATLVLLDSFDHHVGPTFFKFQENVKENVNSSSSSGGGTNDSHVMDDILLLVFDLKYNEVSTLLGLVRKFCISYGVMIVAFVVTSVWVHGVVFVLVVNDLLNTRKSLYRTFMDGALLGSDRLVEFVVMRFLVRDGLSQLLGILFFRGVNDTFTLVNVYIWLKFLPFSAVFPWVKGYEYEFWWILFLLRFLDLLFLFFLDIGAWVVMVDSRKHGREVIDEGCHMFSLMYYPALNLKYMEYFMCHLFVRTTLKRAFVEKVSLALQSLMEVYFMVAWLMCYFSAKSVDANSKGIPFGQQELEAMVKDVDDHQ